MFWVITEICKEPSPLKRMKIIKQFIRIASEKNVFVDRTIK